jgi:hypothetical protein
MMLAKTLAVLSALLLVGSVALGTLGPQDMSLGEALTAADHVRVLAVETWVRGHLSAWVWEHPTIAVLARPIWMVPAAIGLLLAGAAMTAATSRKAPTSRRRRS